jgi:hypothetical protein
VHHREVLAVDVRRFAALAARRGPGRSLHASADGRRFSTVFGQPVTMELTDSFLTDAKGMQRSLLGVASWRLAA